MASSKTDDRPVWCKRVGVRRGRKRVASCSPRTRMRLEVSSRSVRRGGIKRYQESRRVPCCVIVSYNWSRLLTADFMGLDVI
jgi:hypothetical protein